MINDAPLKQLLLKLEEQLLKPRVRHSPDIISNMLADDFFEISSSGRIYNRQTIIKALANEQKIHFSISKFQAVELCSNIVLVTYHAISKTEDDKPPIHSLRSSIWKKFDNNWQMIFHQGTPIS